MAIGKVGSYGTDAPLQNNYIGEALTQVDQMAFRNRQEKRLEEDKKKIQKEKDDAENAVVLGKLTNPTTTRFATQNALAIDASTKLANGVGEKARQYKAGKISKLDLDIYRSNAMAQIDLMNQANKRINEQGAEYAKQLADGKINPLFANDALEFGKAYDKNNLHSELNPDGTLTMYAYDDTDKNNPKIISKGDLSTFGQNSFTPIANYDIDKDISEFKKTYPPVLTETLGATTKTGIKGISPEIENAIDLKVNSLVADKNSLAVANAQRPNGSVIHNVTDPNDIDETKKFLKERYLNAYSPEKTVDEALGRANLDLSRRKEAREAKKDKTTEIMVGTPTVINKAGEIISDVNVSKNTKSFPLGNVIIDSGQGKKQKATNIYVSPTGKMYMKVEETGFEGGGESKKVLTKEGEIKQREFEKWLEVNPEASGSDINARKPNSEDYVTVSETAKKPKVLMLDFGKDANEIGRYALRMGYKGAKELQDDFITRSGGDSFINTNNYSNVTETNRGTIGIKNGKWYDVKTGKEVK